LKEQQVTELEDLRLQLERERELRKRICREIYEVWAGSDGIPAPHSPSEGYLMKLLDDVRDIAKGGLQ
jgi:hypothetical protein